MLVIKDVAVYVEVSAKKKHLHLPEVQFTQIIIKSTYLFLTSFIV